LNSALKEELEDGDLTKKDGSDDLGIEDLSEEPSTEDTLPEEIQKRDPKR